MADLHPVASAALITDSIARALPSLGILRPGFEVFLVLALPSFEGISFQPVAEQWRLRCLVYHWDQPCAQGRC